MSSHIPSTPRIISPSPSPRESFSSPSGNYFGPVTRSLARNKGVTSPPLIVEDRQDGDSGSDPDTRARTRSRSPFEGGRRRRLSGLTSIKPKTGAKEAEAAVNGSANGHLKPPGQERNFWRDLSRSPSPLGLIPIHKEWRTFIHKHEIPRKALHVSIGFVVLWLYVRGFQPSQLAPIMLSLFVSMTISDLIRHRFPALNKIYIRCVGALMRESEVNNYNGTIFFLAGTYIVITLFPKDIGTLGVVLLSWCDTAASTVGRLYGRYTPRIRRGKSLAGSVAAMVTGVATAAFFWGYVAPTFGAPYGFDTGKNTFAYQGILRLPAAVCGFLGWEPANAQVTGNVALGITSVVAGFITAASEAVDLWGWDDNLTIPVLCGVGLWGFFKIFG